VSLDVLVLEDRQLLSQTLTIPVTSTADSGPGTLRAAVATANTATRPVEIDFPLKGAATITLTSGQLELSNTAVPITIDGPGASVLAIDGNKQSQVFEIDKNVTASISGLTIRNGAGQVTLLPVPTGGGVFNQGTVTLTQCRFSDNVSAVGGGMDNLGTATLTDCQFDGNRSGSGGAIFNSGGLTLTGCSLSGNAAPSLDFTYGSVGDFGPGIGGAISNYDGELSLVDCTLTGNTCGNFGGAIFSESAYGRSDLSLTGCTLSDNSSVGYAGTVNAVYGGAIEGVGFFGAVNNVTITGCTLSGNSSIGKGGGVFSYGCTLTMTGCTISGNTTPSAGGGVDAGNGAYGSVGKVSLTNCTISGNSAAAGGGVQVYGPSSLSLVSCTISGNSSTSSPGGGLSVYTFQGSTPQATLTDTIVAGNTGPAGVADDIGGNAPFQVTGSYNLTGTGGSGGLSAANADHNLLGVANPGLALLGDYGGPTETMALLPGSPALHKGTAVSGLTTDQRGFPLDTPVDIGAFQSQPGPLVVDTAIDGLGSPLGELSLRQAVNLADVLTGGATITFDRKFSTRPSVITLTAGPLELSNTTGPVAILGPGTNKLTISGGGLSNDFQVDRGGSAVISGLTITGGVTSGAGGGVLNLGTLTLDDVEVEDNSAAYGGGIFNAGTLTVIDSDVSDNGASTEGGGLYNKGTPVLLIGTSIKHNKPDNISGPVIGL
jgi:hypothetical protein